MKKVMITLGMSALLLTAPMLATATETQVIQNQIVFNDVSEAHWGFSAIHWGLKNQIVNGYPDGSYRPDQNVTQSEFLAMLLKAYNVELTKQEQGEAWDSPLLKYALESNWTLVTDTSKPITRGQVAKLLTNASGKKYNENDSIHYILDAGLSNGKTERSIAGYKGNDLLTRAEAIVFIQNVKTKLAIVGTAPLNEEKYENPNSDIKDTQVIVWNPTPEQKEYATQVFKLIRFDIASKDLKVKVPSVKGKEVTAGLSVNNGKSQLLTLDKLYEYKNASGIKMNISISGELDGGYGTFDKYDIYSRDRLPGWVKEEKIPNTDDIIVIDQYKNVVPLSVVLKALGFDSANENTKSVNQQQPSTIIEPVTWNPMPAQREYGTQVFQQIRYDIKTRNLKVMVPSVKGKEVSAGLAVNGEKSKKLKLDTLYEYDGATGVKLNIRIFGEVDGGTYTFDKYDLYSRDNLPSSFTNRKDVPETDDIIVVDQYNKIVPLNAVLKALGFEAEARNKSTEDDRTVWNPTDEQIAYGNQIFKPLSWDNSTRTLSFSIPKMPGKNPVVGIQYGTKKEKITLGKVYTFKDLPAEFKMDINIYTDDTFTEVVDRYSIMSYDYANKRDWAKGVPTTDLVVQDQYQNDVSLSAVYKALGIK
ncbi:S-layer homology domain-containing protein [Paenibacillus sp. B01]|uniref:S-layer homology domain-containing protein n=1 Tax=Paenibacillus sp. B01 TaxID=2660554 RepID=UPI00129BAA67|nr:S-layer homology domain-containing protein [Paenibacillus sp. B01]QGG57889.1 hypothetical protein GE073_21510 [Paenibacillus sp. B01]